MILQRRDLAEQRCRLIATWQTINILIKKGLKKCFGDAEYFLELLWLWCFFILQMVVWRWQPIVTWRTTSGRTWTTCLTYPQNRRAVQARRHGKDPVTATTLWTCAHLTSLLTATERHRDPEKVNCLQYLHVNSSSFLWGEKFFFLSLLTWNGVVVVGIWFLCYKLCTFDQYLYNHIFFWG